LQVVDAHAYVGPSLFGLNQSPDDLLRTMDACEIECACLCPNRPPDYDLRTANIYVAEAIRATPDRFFGWARVDPWQGAGALDELRRARESLSLNGLMLHPWEETFQIADRLVDPLVEYAGEQRMPVMVETGYAWVSGPLDTAELANRHPDVTIIATHGMQLDSSAFALVDASLAMQNNKNLIMETSGLYASEFMENLVGELGETRFVFGSHSPWFDLRLEVERVRLLDLPPSQKEALIGANILTLMKA